jgi:hypothetical protein
MKMGRVAQKGRGSSHVETINERHYEWLVLVFLPDTPSDQFVVSSSTETICRLSQSTACSDSQAMTGQIIYRSALLASR